MEQWKYYLRRSAWTVYRCRYRATGAGAGTGVLAPVSVPGPVRYRLLPMPTSNELISSQAAGCGAILYSVCFFYAPQVTRFCCGWHVECALYSFSAGCVQRE